MKIKKYTKLKSNKYNVLIDDENVKLYDDVIVKFELLRKDEISEELFNEVVLYNNSLEAYYKALKYIERKLRTEKEVYKYLERDFTKKTTDMTVERLKKDGYLNEEIYLKCYFNDAINLSYKGPNKIKKELKELGYDEIIINSKIEEIDNEVWKEKIDILVKKRIKSNKNYGINKLKLKIVYELGNMGYYKWMIEEVIDNNLFESNDDILNREYMKLYNKLCKKYDGVDLENKILAKLITKGFTYDDVKNIIGQNKKD